MKTEPRDGDGAGKGFKPYLTPLTALALSFGYAVGWGAFMMPGNIFLPGAGPVGTIIGIVVGALTMFVFALNYHRMMRHYPTPGGVFTFARKTFGEDHGFLVGWFLWLTYVAVLWANATAVVMLARFTLGGVFQFGFHYTVAGFDVYGGEVLLSIITIIVGGAFCIFSRRTAAIAQTVFAAVMVLGIVGFFCLALKRHEGGLAAMGPAFSDGASPFFQVMRVLALVPWAFVGFEAISHSAAEFRFPVKRTLGVLVASIVLTVVAYLFLALLPVLSLPEGCPSWLACIHGLVRTEDVSGVPVFAAAGRLCSRTGIALMSTMMLCAMLTGVIAALIAMSRLMFAMSEADLLPKWFGRLSRNGLPRNSMLFVMGVSCAIPFVGRTAASWPVDVSSIGAAVAFGYTSAAAFRTFGGDGTARLVGAKAFGAAGVAIASFFCILLVIPNYVSGTVLSAPSYLILAVWCILGFLFYRHIYKADRNHRFGRSIITWLALVITIIFSSLMWVRQTTFESARDSLVACVRMEDDNDSPAVVAFMNERVDALNVSMLRNAGVELLLLLSSLAIMISLVSILRKRELRLVAEKTHMEDLNRAKSYFFSTVSHDIRTPLNAIIGFSQMLKEGFRNEEDREQAVDSILLSGRTLLKLINDVLDLSKLESGRMEIAPEPVDCQKLLDGIAESFRMSAGKPDIDIRAKVTNMPILVLDPQRIRQIAFNLMGNAVKFTQKGFVEVRADFARTIGRGSGMFRLAVEDSGCGISEEDIKRIATPYSQFGDRSQRNGGTGLGLAISRQLAEAMGGEMTVSSTLGKGTTFCVTIPDVEIGVLDETSRAEDADTAAATAMAPRLVSPHRRMLLVDDQNINLMVLKAMLSKIGDFDLVLAHNGKEALEMLENPDVKPFDAVLTDMWMPEMDGEALVRAIRQRPKFAKLPVYVITADVEARKNYSEMGFTGILLKPITLASLEAVWGVGSIDKPHK